MEDVLPHLLQYKCKIIVDGWNNDKEEFSLFIDDNNLEDIDINTQQYPQIALNKFNIKYFLTDKLKQDYFYYLVNGRAVSKLYGNNNDAKNKTPYLSKVIDDIQTKQPWMFVGGASYIIDIAEKELDKITKKVMDKNNENITYKDIKIVKQDGLNKLVMTKYNVLKQTVEKFNDVKSDEVKDIHKSLDDNLWLLEPKWEYADKIASEKSINTINKLLGLTDEEKNLTIQEIFKKHNIEINYSYKFTYFSKHTLLFLISKFHIVNYYSKFH